MRTYTLRLPDDLLNRLKHIAIEERKTVRQILEELIRKKLRGSEQEAPAEELREGEEVARILDKLDDRKVLAGIRADRRR